MKNKQWTIFAIITLILFFPIGLIIMWAKTGWSKKVKWGVTGVVGVLVFLVVISNSSSSTKSTPATDNSHTEVAKAKEVQVTKAPTATPIPKSPEEILRKIAKDTVGDTKPDIHKTDNGWVVFAARNDMDFTLPLAFFSAKQICRNYMFAVYATKLPIAAVELVLNSKTGDGKYFSAALGKDVAALNSPDTWTDDSVGPTIFYNFLVQNTNSSASTDTNDMGTFVDTNLQ